ncbi:acetate kinase [Agromyces cerinus]|uniref:Acetate kinase n=1 Tax=Agromyces hippuratus TaxID=286438 RepID=A0A852WSL2_9MICO|nr:MULTISPECIES: acetate kinase [Agromyces]MBM7829842.1 acetate kinase [Agromyces cerinus]NYG20697.1 acetate kinase [Agromyces hippuratus]
MSVVLVVNSGSSSLKYQLIDVERSETLASGLVERIGRGVGHARHRHEGPENDSLGSTWDAAGEVADHEAAFAVMLEAFAAHGPSLEAHAPIAVGHRVVQGGARFFEPTVITPLVKINIDELSALAPLHNPANLEGIEAAQRAFPDVPHVAVFDTAFHQTMPPAAYTYAIDRELAAKHRIRRYGFHGTSHRFVSRAAAAFLERPVEELRMIVLHLGNGASVCAVSEGRSVETSMGMTPLEGLVMGTRSGDIDPAVLLHLERRAGLDADGLDHLLNSQSGILGLSGHADMRDLVAARAAGDEASTLALEVYAHRVRSYVGAYAAQLGRVDAIVFTAGVGENSPDVRELALAGLEGFGVELDSERNQQRGSVARRISTDASKTAVLVVPTNEELEIARQTLELVGA